MKNVFYNIAIGDNFIFAFFVRRFTAGRIEFYFAFMKIIINVNEISTKIKSRRISTERRYPPGTFY